MAASAALSYSIKVPVHAKIKRESMPPVAARLQARDFPARSPTTPEVRHFPHHKKKALPAGGGQKVKPEKTKTDIS